MAQLAVHVSFVLTAIITFKLRWIHIKRCATGVGRALWALTIGNPSLTNPYTQHQRALFFLCDGLRLGYWMLRPMQGLPTFRRGAWHLTCLADRLELNNLLPKR